MSKISNFLKSFGRSKNSPLDKEGWPPLVKVTPPTPLPPPPPRVESGLRFTILSESTSVGARCLCCQSNNVTLHDNGSARWVQCHNSPCGMAHYVSMHPELARFFPRRESETWPQHCHLCNHDMESDTDRAEWHGLGNCVPICPTCSGSGTADEIVHLREPETIFEASRRVLQVKAELNELAKSELHGVNYLAKKNEYENLILEWAADFALFSGGLRQLGPYSVNVNRQVYVKLTAAGVNCLRKNQPAIEEVHEGWHKFQLWELMNIFGPILQMGFNDIPFEDNAILFSKPTAEGGSSPECQFCSDAKEIALDSGAVMACPSCQKCKYGCTREMVCVSCDLHRPRKRTAEGGCATQA